MEEKIYKLCKGAGASAITLGILTIVAGLTIGILGIISGGKLLNGKSKILF